MSGSAVINPFDRVKVTPPSSAVAPVSLPPRDTSAAHPATPTATPAVTLPAPLIPTAESGEATLAAAVESDGKKRRGRPAGSKNRSNRGGEPLVFDIETIPDESRLELFDLPPLPVPLEETPADKLPAIEEVIGKTEKDAGAALAGLVVPSDYVAALLAAEKAGKARKGVLDLIAKATTADSSKAAAEQAYQDRIKLLSTTPEFCAIASIGWAVGSGPVQTMVVGDIDHEAGDGSIVTELQILERFWELAAEAKPLVGFYCLGFDLPVILIRSALLDVKPSRCFSRKTWGGEVIDLHAEREQRQAAIGGEKASARLKDVAKWLGITVPAGDQNGSSVYGHMQAKEFDKVHSYNGSDVHITREVYRMYRGFWFA